MHTPSGRVSFGSEKIQESFDIKRPASEEDEEKRAYTRCTDESLKARNWGRLHIICPRLIACTRRKASVQVLVNNLLLQLSPSCFVSSLGSTSRSCEWPSPPYTRLCSARHTGPSRIHRGIWLASQCNPPITYFVPLLISFIRTVDFFYYLCVKVTYNGIYV